MNLIEIANKFPTELEVVKYFERKRWGSISYVNCVFCSNRQLSIKRNKDLRHQCANCKKTYSVTSGTQLHNTRLPLKTWLMAFAIVSDAKKGLSAKQLERNLGIHYETAWNMYHFIRELMIQDNKTIDELEGIVEMDETYIGAKRPRLPNTGDRTNTEMPNIPELDKRVNELRKEGFNFKAKKGNSSFIPEEVKRGRGTNKIPVVGIVERDGNVIAEVMKHTRFEDLKQIVEKYVNEDNSVLVTDEYKAYNRMERIIEHIKIDHEKLYSYKGVNTNSIESFWAIIKRQIMGQHHHVSLKHLPKYVAETVFKYNNRKQDDMFETLVKLSMKNKQFV